MVMPSRASIKTQPLRLDCLSLFSNIHRQNVAEGFILFLKKANHSTKITPAFGYYVNPGKQILFSTDFISKTAKLQQNINNRKEHFPYSEKCSAHIESLFHSIW